jgi:hypothetical protein
MAEAALQRPAGHHTKVLHAYRSAAETLGNSQCCRPLLLVGAGTQRLLGLSCCLSLDLQGLPEEADESDLYHTFAGELGALAACRPPTMAF